MLVNGEGGGVVRKFDALRPQHVRNLRLGGQSPLRSARNNRFWSIIRISIQLVVGIVSWVRVVDQLRLPGPVDVIAGVLEALDKVEVLAAVSAAPAQMVVTWGRRSIKSNQMPDNFPNISRRIRSNNTN